MKNKLTNRQTATFVCLAIITLIIFKAFSLRTKTKTIEGTLQNPPTLEKESVHSHIIQINLLENKTTYKITSALKKIVDKKIYECKKGEHIKMEVKGEKIYALAIKGENYMDYEDYIQSEKNDITWCFLGLLICGILALFLKS